MAVPILAVLFAPNAHDDAGHVPPERHRGRSALHVATTATTSPPVDLAQVAEIRAGDVEAFSNVYRQYYSALWAFTVRYIHSEAEADDIVQDVFRKVWEQRETLVLRGTLRGFLFTAAHNRALNVLRNVGTATRLTQAAMTAGAHPPGMGAMGAPCDQHAAEIRDLREAVDTIVETFPERRREVFMLKWRDGLSYGEIAELLGLSRKTVELHLTNAYRVLRAELRDVFEGDSAP